jgi:hypothetical protein
LVFERSREARNKKRAAHEEFTLNEAEGNEEGATIFLIKKAPDLSAGAWCLKNCSQQGEANTLFPILLIKRK